jgi:protein SCO1/2
MNNQRPVPATMNKTALFGLLITLVIPLASYLIVKTVGEGAVNMPRKYFADSVIQKVKDGKTSYDTLWHRIPSFSLTDHVGETTHLDSLEGKILVVNTFFTRCPNICPALTRNIRKLQASFENPKRKKWGDTPVVYFLSVTVDPLRDSVEALKKWADRFYVNSDNWRLLTGDKQSIYDLLLQQFKLAAQDGAGIDSNFIHTEKVTLVDRNRVIRGYYNGLDSASMGRLAEDIGKLHLERNRNRPSIFRQYIPLIPILAAIPFIVLVVMLLLARNRKKEVF